jgi:hypothetical protein
VKTIVVPSPRAGAIYRLQIDGTGDTPGITPPPGLYDVEVVQDIAVGPTCLGNDSSGPDEEVDVHTTIGQVRLP